MKVAFKSKVAQYATIAIIVGLSSPMYGSDDFPIGTSWPDLPKETSFPAAIGTIPDFSYRIEGKDKTYHTTGIGVTTASAGTTMYGGAVTVLLNYNLNTNTNANIFRNNVVVVSRIGLGNRWDIAFAVPQMYQLGDNGALPASVFGSVGNLGVTLHKQHFAKKFSESALSIATNYIIGLPLSKNGGEYAFGWGVGITWQYRNMAAQADIEAKVYTDARNPDFAIKGGYYYALTSMIYTGVEFDWSYTAYAKGSSVYTAAIGKNTLAIGPTISIKVPKLKNSAFGIGFYGDLFNDYEALGQKSQAWKFASRLAIFY